MTLIVIDDLAFYFVCTNFQDDGGYCNSAKVWMEVGPLHVHACLCVMIQTAIKARLRRRRFLREVVIFGSYPGIDKLEMFLSLTSHPHPHTHECTLLRTEEQKTPKKLQYTFVDKCCLTVYLHVFHFAKLSETDIGLFSTHRFRSFTLALIIHFYYFLMQN